MPLQPAKRLPSRFKRKIGKGRRKELLKNRAVRRRAQSHERVRRSYRKILSSIAAKKTLLLSVVCGLIAICACVGAVLVLSSPLFTVQSISIARTNARLDIEDVQRRLFPFYGQHMFRVSVSDIENLLSVHIEDLASVTISKFYPSELRIGIELDPLVAKLDIVQPQEPEELEEDTVHIDYLTAEGVYVVTATPDNKEPLPTIHILDWGVRPQAGERLIPAELLTRLNAAEVLLLRRLGEQVRERSVFVRAQEFHLRLDRHTLWLDMRSPIQHHIERYIRFLEEYGADAAREYIDLRLSDRVVYR